MISSSSTEFTARDGRRFAFPVGTAFLVLCGILFWREKQLAFEVTLGLGVVLWIAGIVVPRHLGPVYHGWMKMALMISKVTTPVFMAIVYFVVLTPMGLIMRLVGKKPIRHPVQDGGFWYQTRGRAKSDLRRQF